MNLTDEELADINPLEIKARHLQNAKRAPI